ncbi:hypothetical protein [uncultured Photobacterium sp.]|uniref:hypothetical protein n=1 Tax=uncultured Photobacterium sp. TaxID=173973 RepID=UPI0026117255|nr:hypothetical protein [uncultured Photobacterium sp.]
MSTITRYVSTDLDIFSRQDLSTLAAFFQDCVCILHCGWREETLFQLSLELATDDYASIESDLDALLTAAEHLPEELKPLWCSALEVDFNLVFEAGGHHRHRVKIPASLLKRVVALNGTLSITAYPLDAD